MFRPIKMVAKRTAATFDPDILLAVGCDLTQPVASQPGSLSSRPKFQSLDSKSAFQTHEIVIYSYLIYLMLIHVIFKIIKPYHTHIVNHIKLSRLVQNGSASTSPGIFSAIAHLQGRKNGCPALRHHPWGPRTSSPRGTSGPSWWGSPGPSHHRSAVPAPRPPPRASGRAAWSRSLPAACPRRWSKSASCASSAACQWAPSRHLQNAQGKQHGWWLLLGFFLWMLVIYLGLCVFFGWFWMIFSMNVWMMFEDFWRISGDFWGNGSRQQKREIQPGNTSGIGKSSTNGYYIIHRGLSPACQGARE